MRRTRKSLLHDNELLLHQHFFVLRLSSFPSSPSSFPSPSFPSPSLPSPSLLFTLIRVATERMNGCNMQITNQSPIHAKYRQTTSKSLSRTLRRARFDCRITVGDLESIYNVDEKNSMQPKTVKYDELYLGLIIQSSRFDWSEPSWHCVSMVLISALRHLLVLYDFMEYLSVEHEQKYRLSSRCFKSYCESLSIGLGRSTKWTGSNQVE